MKLRTATLLLLGTSLSLPMTAYAQTAPAGDEQQGLEEIVVTAQKRAENLQKVPLAITALSSAMLEKQGVTGLANLQTTPPPGLFVQPFAGDPTLLIIDTRGVVNTDPGQGTIESGTAVYIDDVYLGRSQGSGIELADPERIEVLRGPQGTLFGRNAEGGAVRIVTKKPTGVLGGNAKITYGNFGRLRGEAHLNLPEIAGFKIKLDVLNNHFDGYTRNGAARLSRLDAQKKFGYQDAQGYRGAIRWEPTEALTLDYSYDWVKQKITTDYYVLDRPGQPPYPATAPSQYFSPRPDDSINSYAKQSWIPLYLTTFDTKSQGHNFQGEFELNDEMKLRSITGYRKLRTGGRGQLGGAFVAQSFAGLGIPGGALPIQFFTPADAGSSFGLPATTLVYGFSGVVPDARMRQSQFSQEVQLVGNTDQFEYVLGGYYFREKVRDTRQSLFSIFYTGPNLTNPTPVNPYALPFPGQGQTSQTAKTRSYAAFAQLTWTPTFAEDLHLTGGLRYTDDTKRFNRSLLGGTAVNITPAPFKESRFDPAFTIAYDFTQAINGYARYSQAYRAGGVSLRSPNFLPFGAEVNKAVELGVKADLLDRRLRANIAVFSNRISNRQLGIQTDPNDPAVTDTINAPGITKVRGFEIETTAVPTQGLQFSLNYAFQDAKQPSFASIDPFAVFALTNTPRHALTASADWTVPTGMAATELVFSANYSLASKTPGTVRTAFGNFTYPIERNIANGRVTLQNIEVGGAKLKIAAFVNNVMDTAYPTYTAPGANAILLPPRTYGMEAGISF